MNYSVYQDYDCVQEFSTERQAIIYAKKIAKENPDSVIDVFDYNEEHSLWGIN